MTTFQLLPAEAMAAPIKPPISAWLELEGKPTATSADSRYRPEQAAYQRHARHAMGVHQALAHRGRDGRAGQRAAQIRDGRQHDGLGGGQDLGADHRGDRVGRVVEAVDELEDQRHQRGPSAGESWRLRNSSGRCGR